MRSAAASRGRKDDVSGARRNAVMNLFQVIASVLAAFFGVQSRRNRERDFSHGRAVHFIVVGVALTVALVVAIWLAVRLALHHAGG